jgi:hypothetical protein
MRSPARSSMRTASALAALFVEEPLPAHNVEGIDLALPFLKEGLCSVIQPDLAMMGGMTECLRLTRAAELFGVEVVRPENASLIPSAANASTKVRPIHICTLGRKVMWFRTEAAKMP